MSLDALSLAGAILMTGPAEERHFAKSSIAVSVLPFSDNSVLLSVGARKNYLCSLENIDTATE